MNSFPTLEDYLAPNPLPALIAVLMVLGLKHLGSLLIRKTHKGSAPMILEGAAFLLVTALLAAAVHLLAYGGLAYYGVLRILAWSLAALGLLEIVSGQPARMAQSYDRLKSLFREQSFWGRAALLLMGITAAALLLTALGPATDADSLDYHLGVPLDILRHHGVYPRPDWFFARMAGLGEYLNLLGLAGGTDNFGAVLQFAGVILILVALTSLTNSIPDKILMAVGVLGCPVAVFLLSSQKHLMLPVAATTIALILLAQRAQSLEPVTLLLALGAAFFAMACKHQFILSGALVVGVGLVLAHSLRRGGWACSIALVAYLVLVLPMQWQNYQFYGDPLSPLLEQYRHNGNAALIRFASFSRISDDSFIIPLNLILPASPGSLTVVLGLGVLLLPLAFGPARRLDAARILLIGALIMAPFSLALSKIGPRYFLEPYLWILAVAAMSAWGLVKTTIFRLMVLQLLVMCIVAGYGAVTLFPGALTRSLRDQVMMRSAYDYGAIRWLGTTLPGDSIVLAELRSVALMSRPFVSIDFFMFANLDDPRERDQVFSLLKSYRVNTMVIHFPPSEEIARHFGAYLGECLDGPKTFGVATRNPWNAGGPVQLAAYRLNLTPGLISEEARRAAEKSGTADTFLRNPNDRPLEPKN